MAESKKLESCDRASKTSSILPKQFYESCFEVDDDVATGYCQNYDEELEKRSKSLNKDEKCPRHHGYEILSFCQGHSECCCIQCLFSDHEDCHTDKISNLASNIHNSKELKTLTQRLVTLREGFYDHRNKTKASKAYIEKSYRDAISDMKTMREEFNKLMTKTEAQADRVKEEDFQKIEEKSANCEMAIDQINKLTNSLDLLHGNRKTENLFISMKRAEHQLMSLQDSLATLDKDNTVRWYKFEPDEQLKSLLKDLKVPGQLLSVETSQPIGFSKNFWKAVSPEDQKAKTPVYDKDIKVKCSPFTTVILPLYGSEVLPNKQILITDWNNQEVKLIDTKQDTILSELRLPGRPFDITKVEDNEAAVIVNDPNTIQFIAISKNTLSKTRNISMNGQCRGIAYNERNKTLVVTYVNPGKVEILNMEGDVIRCLEKDRQGNPMFSWPKFVAMSPDTKFMYVSDRNKHTVSLITQEGDIINVYRDKCLQHPEGICVHSSGLVYVASYISNTVYQLDPDSGEFKLLLQSKDGLENPTSISYCELTDTIYIGMWNTRILKVFKMK